MCFAHISSGPPRVIYVTALTTWLARIMCALLLPVRSLFLPAGCLVDFAHFSNAPFGGCSHYNVSLDCFFPACFHTVPPCPHPLPIIYLETKRGVRSRSILYIQSGSRLRYRPIIYIQSGSRLRYRSIIYIQSGSRLRHRSIIYIQSGSRLRYRSIMYISADPFRGHQAWGMVL